jgi:flagellar biosynthesis/type III secretory pathway M-ring protein FliF/YscJ
VTLLAAPALPLHTAGKYVAGAYVVFVVMLVVYLGIMTLRTRRTRRELAELQRDLAERQAREQLDGTEFGEGAAGGTASSERDPTASPDRDPTASPNREAAV